MTITSLGIVGTAAGAPLAQSKGSDVERAGQDGNDQHRQVQGELHAEHAAGIAEPDGQDHSTDERDADGRRPWEIPAKAKPKSDDSTAAAPTQSKDASGDSGTNLDLIG